MSKDGRYFWFHLDPYVHVASIKSSCLLYNPLNGRHIIYWRNAKIAGLMHRVLSKNNMGVIKLSAADLADESLGEFIRKVKEYYMGDLIDAAYSLGKPVQMRHFPKINKDFDKIRREKRDSGGEDTLKYLFEISFYINTECTVNCTHCQEYCKQFPCCARLQKRSKEIPLEEIIALLKQTKNSGLSRVNILGGNIFAYSSWQPLLSSLQEETLHKTFYCNYHHLKILQTEMDPADFNNATLRILVTPPYAKEALISCLNKTKPLRKQTEYQFIVASEAELKQAEQLSDDLKISSVTLKPYANESTLDFFRENVFLDIEDIIGASVGSTEIYANLILNRLHFGRLVILPNKRVHANINTPVLGVLGKDSIYKIVHEEMYHGRTWRRTRKKIPPCRDCILSALCPPPGNYEYALKRNNLCHIKGDEQ